MSMIGLLFNKDLSIKQIDSEAQDDISYDCIANVESIYSKNGNGNDKVTLLNPYKEPNDITFNNWRLSANIPINFNWSGRDAELNITDSSDITRKKTITSNPNSRFNGSPYTVDIISIIKSFNEICKFVDWTHIDLITKQDRIKVEMETLKKQLELVEERISSYNTPVNINLSFLGID